MSSKVCSSTPAAPPLASQRSYAWARTSFRYTLSYSAWKRKLGDSFAFACNAVCNFCTLGGVVRLIANPSVLRCFLRSSLTEVPSLRRSYPASQVLRTSPPPHTARSFSHELPVDPDCDHRMGLPVLRLVSYAYMPSPLSRQG